MTTNVDGLWMPRYTVVGSVLYEDGRPTSSGWHHVDDKWYWTDGANFFVGWKEIDGEDYHFEADGTLTMGWQDCPDGRRRLMMEDGHWAPDGFMGPGNGGFFGGPAGPFAPVESEGGQGSMEPGSPFDVSNPEEESDTKDSQNSTELVDPATQVQTAKTSRINNWNSLGPTVEEPTHIEQIVSQGFDVR